MSISKRFPTRLRHETTPLGVARRFVPSVQNPRIRSRLKAVQISADCALCLSISALVIIGLLAFGNKSPGSHIVGDQSLVPLCEKGAIIAGSTLGVSGMISFVAGSILKGKKENKSKIQDPNHFTQRL